MQVGESGGNTICPVDKVPQTEHLHLFKTQYLSPLQTCASVIRYLLRTARETISQTLKELAWPNMRKLADFTNMRRSLELLETNSESLKMPAPYWRDHDKFQV